MRHGKKVNHLGRTASHRKAMLSNMACSLIQHKRIKTTLAKAKALRKYVEPLMTKAKNDTTHNRRVVFSYLQNKEAIKELFGDISSKIAGRPGGYTRILKIGFRPGDGAEMCIMELVDYNEDMLQAPTQAKKKTRRGRKKASGNDQTSNQVEKAAATVATTEIVEDAVADVEETTQEVTEEVQEEITDTTEEATDSTEEAAGEDDTKEDA